MSRAELSRCRSCGARIWWARTSAGRAMPVDAYPGEGGIVRLTRAAGDRLVATVVPQALRDPREQLYRPHWVSCPQAGRWRRGGGRRG